MTNEVDKHIESNIQPEATKAAREEAYRLKQENPQEFLRRLEELRKGFGNREPKPRIYRDTDIIPENEVIESNTLNFATEVWPVLYKQLTTLKLNVDDKTIQEIQRLADKKATSLEKNRIKREVRENIPAEKRSDARFLSELPYEEQASCYVEALKEYVAANKRSPKITEEEKNRLAEKIRTDYLNRIYDGDTAPSSHALKRMVESAVEAICTDGGVQVKLQVDTQIKIPKPENASLLLDTASQWVPMLGYGHPLVKATLPAALRCETKEGWEKRGFDENLHDTLKQFSRSTRDWKEQEQLNFQPGKLIESLYYRSPKSFLLYAPALQYLTNGGDDFISWSDKTLKAAATEQNNFFEQFELMMRLYENNTQKRALIKSASASEALAIKDESSKSGRLAFLANLPKIIELNLFTPEELKPLVKEAFEKDTTYILNNFATIVESKLFTSDELKSWEPLVKPAIDKEPQNFIKQLPAIVESKLFTTNELKAFVKVNIEKRSWEFPGNVAKIVESKIFPCEELKPLIKATIEKNPWDFTGNIVKIVESKIFTPDELKCLVKGAFEKEPTALLGNLDKIHESSLFTQDELKFLTKVAIKNAPTAFLEDITKVTESKLFISDELKPLMLAATQEDERNILSNTIKIVESELFTPDELKPLVRAAIELQPFDFPSNAVKIVESKIFDPDELRSLANVAFEKEPSGLLSNLSQITESELFAPDELKPLVNAAIKKEPSVFLRCVPEIIESKVLTTGEIKSQTREIIMTKAHAITEVSLLNPRWLEVYQDNLGDLKNLIREMVQSQKFNNDKLKFGIKRALDEDKKKATSKMQKLDGNLDLDELFTPSENQKQNGNKVTVDESIGIEGKDTVQAAYDALAPGLQDVVANIQKNRSLIFPVIGASEAQAYTSNAQMGNNTRKSIT